MFTLALMVGAKFLQSTLKQSRTASRDVQSYNVARAGLTDAINWFKRQSHQPVTSFSPQPNASDPTLGDTNDPYNIKPHGMNQLGIVREFALDSSNLLFGRYEVGKQTKLTRDTYGHESNYVIWDPGASPAAWVALSSNSTNTYDGVTDISKDYGYSGQGFVWRLEAQGYVYTLPTGAPTPGPGAPRFYTSPNFVLGQVRLQTEIRSLQINEFGSPVVGVNGSDITFNNASNVIIDATTGNKPAVVYLDTTGTPTPNTPPSTFTVSSGQVYDHTAPHHIEWNDVFGVASGSALSGYADISVTDVTKLPAQMPQMALTYINPASPPATFTSSRPLNGGGVLAVDGNLTIASNSYSVFSGIIYVHGDVTLNSPFTLNGALICTGKITVNSSSNNVHITYMPTLISQVQSQLANYRESRAPIVVTQ